MIYAIKSGSFVKIGFCAYDPIRRLEKLQIGNPMKLKLIALFDGNIEVEREWHFRWRKERVRGEWFKLTREPSEALKPHAVDHAEVSRNRPPRKINGVDARVVYNYVELVAAGIVNEDGTLSEAA